MHLKHPAASLPTNMLRMHHRNIESQMREAALWQTSFRRKAGRKGPGSIASLRLSAGMAQFGNPPALHLTIGGVQAAGDNNNVLFS